MPADSAEGLQYPVLGKSFRPGSGLPCVRSSLLRRALSPLRPAGVKSQFVARRDQLDREGHWSRGVQDA